MVTSGVAAVTSAAGEFELTNLAATSYQLNVLDRGRPLPMKSKAAAKVTLAAGEHKTGVELVVDRPDGVIQGTVTGPDGKPLADAWVSVEQSFDDMISDMLAQQEGGSHEISVEARDDGGESNSIAPVLTDANGHFAIANLPRVPWTVTAEAQAGKLRGRLVKITPDATIAIPISNIRELTGTVHVTGATPPYFTVELQGPTSAQRAFAWSDGTFAFARVDPGDYTINVSSSAGTAEAKVTVGADNAHVDVTLTQNATIIGKLVDADGKPVPDLGVVAVPDTGDGRLQIRITGEPDASGPDGNFHISTKPGKVTIAVLTGTGSPTTKPGQVAVAGQTLDVGSIVITPKKP
jgi:protocatechuate 3,4-dioxygenase beta subunit